MNLSIVIVAYKSAHLLDKVIQDIPKSFEILIIENSLDQNLKDKIEKKYSNTKVIIPDKNLGLGKAMNIGINSAKNNFVWCLCPDVKISTSCYMEFFKLLENFNDFTLISPTYYDENIHKNYKTITTNKKKEINKILKYELIEVDEIDFATVIINKSKVDLEEIMDENIHLYFENTEVCLRFRKQNKKLFVVNNLKFIHYGTQSSDISLKHEIQLHRNWHYCWSKFYYLRKHFSYLYALRKTLPNMIRAIKKCIFFTIKKDKVNYKLHLAELSGLINSYLLKKSSYRPKLDKI
jgi:N-acetylglucosaminyl-diphospho-decaprenol L-rhamnosyltransferase